MDKLKIIPLGGLGEIGKNMMAIECGNDIVIVDVGLMFPGEDTPGVDLVIPDFSYVIENKHKVRGVAITHGHEDHVGALPFLLRQLEVPVYAPRLAHGLVSLKVKDNKRGESMLHTVDSGDIIKMGDMSVEFFRVCHSIPDAMGLMIRTPVGAVIHTGDFKFDHTPVDGKPSDLAKLAEYGKEGVLLLCSDSTYVEIPGYTPSEQIVSATFDHIMAESTGRVIVATFASLVSRVQQVIDSAAKSGRKVAIVGRSMSETVAMAQKLDYIRSPKGTLVSFDQIKHLPAREVAIVTTGTQGEPTSALVRMANKDHRQVQIVVGDTVVMSATAIPGNQTVVSKTIDNLFRLGANVLYERIAMVHVHGHAAQEELKLMMSLTKPKYFVPIHGEYHHLVLHGRLAQTMGIPAENTFVMEDGDTLEITAKGAKRGERVSAGPVYVDGMNTWKPDSAVLRDRRALSNDGVVVVVVPVDLETGYPVGDPEIVSSGFVDAKQADELLEASKEEIIKALNQGEEHNEWSYIQAKVKEVLGKYYYAHTKRRPLILPIAVEV